MNKKPIQIGRTEAVTTFYKTLFSDNYERAVEYLPYSHDPDNSRSQYVRILERLATSGITINKVNTKSDNNIKINTEFQKRFNEYAFASIINDKVILPRAFLTDYIHLGESNGKFKVNIQDGVAVNQQEARTGRVSVTNFNPDSGDWSTITLSSPQSVNPKQIWENVNSSDARGVILFTNQGTVDISNFDPDVYYLFLWGCDTGASKPKNCRWLKPRILKKVEGRSSFGEFINTITPIDAHLLRTSIDVNITNENSTQTVIGETIVYRIDTEGWYVGGLLPRYKEDTVNKSLPPEANFTYSPENPVVGQKITFDASQSNDSDDSIRRFEWDLNADNGFEKQGKKISYSFNNPGTHRVRLRVTDDSGATATKRVEISVQSSNDNAKNDTYRTIPSSKYRLQRGDVTEIEIAGRTLYVIENIPDTDSNRVAVTNTKYQLVDLPTTKDAILLDTWPEIVWPGDWQKEIGKLHDLQNSSRNNELFGRALDLGWDLTEIFIYIVMKDNESALEATLDASTDAIEWKMENVERPYRDTFQKLTACLQNAQTVKELAKDIESYSNLGDDLQRWADAALTMHDVTTSGSPLSAAWKQMTAELFSHSSYSNSASLVLEGSEIINSGSRGKIFIAAMKKYAKTMESVIKAKTTIHAITNAYTHIRTPVVKTLKEVHARIADGNASVSDIPLYNAYLLANYQMNALLFTAASHYWQEISNGPDGIIWDAIHDAQRKANRFDNWATDMVETGILTQDIYGAGLQLVEDTHQRSINAELHNVQEDR